MYNPQRLRLIMVIGWCIWSLPAKAGSWQDIHIDTSRLPSPATFYLSMNGPPSGMIMDEATGEEIIFCSIRLEVFNPLTERRQRVNFHEPDALGFGSSCINVCLVRTNFRRRDTVALRMSTVEPLYVSDLLRRWVDQYVLVDSKLVPVNRTHVKISIVPIGAAPPYRPVTEKLKAARQTPHTRFLYVIRHKDVSELPAYLVQAEEDTPASMLEKTSSAYANSTSGVDTPSFPPPPRKLDRNIDRWKLYYFNQEPGVEKHYPRFFLGFSIRGSRDPEQAVKIARLEAMNKLAETIHTRVSGAIRVIRRESSVRHDDIDALQRMILKETRQRMRGIQYMEIGRRAGPDGKTYVAILGYLSHEAFFSDVRMLSLSKFDRAGLLQHVRNELSRPESPAPRK